MTAVLCVGADVASIERVGVRIGNRLPSRCFTAGEMERLTTGTDLPVSATAVWGAKEALVKAIGGRTPNFAWSAIDVAPCGPSCGAAWHHRLAEALPSGPEAGHATASFDGYPLADVAWSAVDGRVFTVVTVPSDRG